MYFGLKHGWFEYIWSIYLQKAFELYLVYNAALFWLVYIYFQILYGKLFFSELIDYMPLYALQSITIWCLPFLVIIEEYLLA